MTFMPYVRSAEMRTSRWSLVVFVTLTMLMANWNAYSESCDPGCAGVYESCAATKAAGLGSCCQDQNVYYGTCVDNELEGIVTVDHGLIVPEHSEDCYEFVNPGICDTFPVLCWLYCLARLNPGTDSNASFQTLSPPAICLYVRSDCTDCWGGYAGGLNDCAVQYQQCCGGAGGGGGAGVPSGVQLLPPAGPGDPAAVTRGGKALACVGEPVDLATGNMYLTHTDYTASGLSRELSLVRTYNSQNQNSGIFGVGWSTPFDEELTVIDPLHLSISRGNGSVVYFGRYNESETIYVPYMPPDDKSQVIVDESGTDTEYVLMLKSGEKRVFDSAGRFIGISDRNDNVTTLTYDQSGRLTTVTSPTGRELSFVYNAAGKVSSVADGVNGSIGPEYDPSILGTVASYEYDPASGLLSEVTYPDGSSYLYVYTYNSGTSGYYLSSVRDALNNILEAHEYDTEDAR